MDDKSVNKLIKTIQRNIEPPAGLKDKMLKEIMLGNKNDRVLQLSPFEKFIFEKPLRTACALSPAISGILWALMGRGYSNILLSFIEKR